MKKTIAFILVLVLVAFSNIPALAEIKKGSKGNDVIELQ